MRRITLAIVTMFVLVIGMLATAPAGAQEQRANGSPATESTVAKVDLNTATATELESLPGIGPRTSELIIEYRAKNKGFKKIEELMSVRGIGEKSFLKLRSLITVTPVKASKRKTSS